MQCQKALIENESAVCLNWMDAEHQQRNDAKSIVINITKVVKAYRKEDPSVENKGVLTKLISFKKNDKKKPAGVDVVPDDFSNYCLHCPTYWYVTAWEHVVRIPVVGMDRLMELVHEDRTRQEKEHMDRLAAEAEIRARNKADGGADVKPPEELDSDDESDDMEPDPTSSPRCNDSNTSISCDGVDDKCLLADLLNGGNKEVPSKFDIFGIRDSADYEDAVRVYWEEQVSAKKFGYVFMNPLETAMNSVSASPVPVRSDSRDSLNNDGEKSGSCGGSGRATSAHDKNALENAMAMALDQEKILMRIEELVAIVARESDMIRGVREEQCKSRVQYIRKGLVKHVTNVLEETIK